MEEAHTHICPECGEEWEHTDDQCYEQGAERLCPDCNPDTEYELA